MMKINKYILVLIILGIVSSCSSDNDSDAEKDTIVGVWSEWGDGITYPDGTEDFTNYLEIYDCLSKSTFTVNGDFNAIYYNALDNQCIEKSRDVGSWKKISESEYEFLSTNSNNPEDVASVNTLTILFPDANTMRIVFNPIITDQAYGYEQYKRIE